jgi:ABC-type transport system involved in multi-copper enzyme maturation permease subunit
MSARPLARRELRDAVRRWWFLVNAAVFALAGLLFVLFGQNDAMLLGERGYARVLAGLMQLGLVFVPLMAVVPSLAAIAGEREAGTLDYLLAQPVTRGGVYGAKWAGVVTAVVLSLTMGLSLTMTIATARGVPAASAAALVACTTLLAAAFVSLGMWISALSGSRTRATSLGLSVWLVLLGLGSLGVVSAFVRWGLPAQVLETWSIANPIEAYRLATLAILDPDVEALGPVGASLLAGFGRAGLIAASTGSIATWAVVGFVGGLTAFARTARAGGRRSGTLGSARPTSHA